MDFSGWEKLSLVDFDHRLTTTLFVAGCPFRCPFCHNEGQDKDNSADVMKLMDGMNFIIATDFD